MVLMSLTWPGFISCSIILKIIFFGLVFRSIFSLYLCISVKKSFSRYIYTPAWQTLTLTLTPRPPCGPQLALERGEKLSELEDRAERMKDSGEQFANAAHSLMNKYKDKKWYQFWLAAVHDVTRRRHTSLDCYCFLAVVVAAITSNQLTGAVFPVSCFVIRSLIGLCLLPLIKWWWWWTACLQSYSLMVLWSVIQIVWSELQRRKSDFSFYCYCFFYSQESDSNYDDIVISMWHFIFTSGNWLVSYRSL